MLKNTLRARAMDGLFQGAARVSASTVPDSSRTFPETGRQDFSTRVNSRWFWLVSVLSAIVLVFWLSPWRQSIPPEALPDALSDEPDLYIQKARITQFEISGAINYKLFADEIRHFQKNDLTKLFSPHLIIHNEKRPPWDVRSNLGVIRKQPSPSGNTEEVVYLEDQVELEQQLGSGDYLRIRSKAMRIYPDRRYAETEQDVIIDTNVGRTKAGGLKGDLANGVMRLSSSKTQRVQTIVLPDQYK